MTGRISVVCWMLLLLVPTSLPGQESLQGRVLDRATGAPLVGARVWWVRGFRRRPGGRPRGSGVPTDQEGRFQISVPAEGRGVLLVRAADHLQAMRPLRGPPRSSLVIRLERGLQLRGEVRDASSGQPVNNASIAFRGQTTRVDGEGRFQMGGLPAEFRDGALTISAPGYTTLFWHGRVAGAGFLHLLLRPGASLAVHVQDDEGAPLAGVEVRVRLPFAEPYSALERQDWRARSDPQGQALFSELPQRQPLVAEARAKGRIPAQSLVVEAKPGGTKTRQISLTLSRGRHLAVQVLDGFGQPLAGAEVRLLPLCEPRQAFQGYTPADTTRGAIRFAACDPQGQAHFDLLPANPITLEVRLGGYLTVMTLAEPGPADKPPVKLTLERDPHPPGNQIPWRGGVAQALGEARRRHLPVMIQMTMDGERANDWMAGHHFKDPEVVRVARTLPILLASAFGPGGLHAKGVPHGVKGGISTRYGAVPPRVYQHVESWARKTFFGGRPFQVPREIFLTPGGRVIIHRHYYLSQRDLVRLMLRGARFMNPSLPLRLARPRLRPLERLLGSADPAARQEGCRRLLILVNSQDEHARGLLFGLAAMGLPAAQRLAVLRGIIIAGFPHPASGLKAFVEDPNPRVRAAAYTRLKPLVPVDQDVLNLLARRVGETDPKARAQLDAALNIQPAKPDGFLVKHPDLKGRFRILEELIRTGRVSTALTLETLQALPARGWNRCLRALAAAGTQAARRLIQQACGTKGLRAVAAWRALGLALRGIGKEGSGKDLRALLPVAAKAPSSFVREEAARILGEDLAGGHSSLLSRLLKDSDFHVRFEAARGLLLRQDLRGAALLLEGLEHGDLQEQAQGALDRLREGERPRTREEWRFYLEDAGFLEPETIHKP